MSFEFLQDYFANQTFDPLDVNRQVQALTGEHYCSVKNQPKDSRKAVFLHRKISNTSINYLTYGQEVVVRATKPSPKYHIQIVTRGSCEIQTDTKRILADLNTGVIINPTSKAKITYSDDCEKVIVLLSPDYVANELAGMTHIDVSKPIEFLESFDLSQMPGQGLLELLGHLSKDVFAGSSYYGDSSSLSAAAERLLVQYLLRGIENSCSELIKRAEEDPQPAWLARLNVYIEENIDNAISPADLAKAAGMNIRTFYERLSAQKNISPMAYVKKLKLEKVRQELQRAHITGKTITEIALEFGFTHMGRFSADYKQQYHELPSRTVRNLC